MALSKPTLFVLGAGASKEYGYPLGHALIDRIQKHSQNPDSSINNIFNTSEAEIAARRLAELIELFDPISIDAFISQQSKNEARLEEIGKYYITKSILEFEALDKLKKRPKSPDSSEANWYRTLLHSILPDDPKEIGSEDLNFRIITFNYDVSLDYYLVSRISASSYLTREQKKSYLGQLSKCIWHVYGQVRPVPWEEHEPFLENINRPVDRIDYQSLKYRYGILRDRHFLNNYLDSTPFQSDTGRLYQRISNMLIEANYKNIEIIGENRGFDLPISISNFLLSTENLRIVFLGFGFDNQNLKRIFGKNHEYLSRFLDQRGEVYYTNYEDLNLINSRVSNLFKLDSQRLNRRVLVHKSSNGVYDALSKDFEL